jgi:prevent-host-death family protein
MEELTVSEARENFSEAVEDAQKKPVQILKHGKPVAVLINPSLFEKFLDSMEELEDIADFDEAIASKSKKIPWAQVKADLGIA